ncbi:16S rRNA (cytosine(967)-C(5))-methyltransferase RsmB [Liquorilactobacillus mali]|nr:16S rRNA (cytosine(967)-C(5))-methyltransferase RsmB [Liquorilactobacillus mali]EJE98173.1 16S rRNA methyltransferase [Liquorilactobacillus mali KCTC 3596 = DSM 20444]MDC7951918.1 16S rRNA (cytosine(967)-C(5))-methyltransferase RsmB [Liquorilactobacillus mali]MDV7757132.1 16S rRNA (cytosine(967)-C(5))-methyltransferase RsmB [Liquorilactobacillus mali]QFQ75035.1 16S rRNA (cytosine(967)-C(5))-methyltransferase RsmB [Liquorilactobacillus mali]
MNEDNKNPRLMAVEILTKIAKNGAYSNLALNQVLKKDQMSRVDANLLTIIVYGVLQNLLLLEFWLEPFVKGKKMDDWVKQLLLMSLYQLKFLDKVPNHAVLNEAIKIAKSKGHDGTRKFVTGVLHAILRKGVHDAASIEDENERLSIVYSVPVWIVEELKKQVGYDKTVAILNSLNKAPKQAIRVNESKASIEDVKTELTREGFKVENSQVAAGSLIVEKGHVSSTRLFEEGKIMLQDESAGLVVEAMNLNGDEQVLDACAAPGGKTMQIADYLRTGTVTALDIHKHKVKLIKENARKCGFEEKVNSIQLDARKLNEHFEPESFNQILVDAPCSGIGLMRRKPEVRYEKSLQDSLNLHRVQVGILDKVANYIEINGYLTYSTCTILETENTSVIKEFLEMHHEFEQVEVKTRLNLPNTKKSLTIYPDDYESDGFFITRLRRVR